MSTLHHEDLLWAIYDEVIENFPYLSEDDQIKKTYELFEELAQ